MKSLWIGYRLGLVWCVLALALLALASYYLPAVDMPWTIDLVAATASVLGVLLLITWIRAYTQPVPTKKELDNEYYVGVIMLLMLVVLFMVAATLLRYATSKSRAAALFDPQEAALISHSNMLLLQGESYEFTKVALADIESGADYRVKPGWVRLAQQGDGVLRITAVDPPDPNLPIGTELSVSAPLEKPDWHGSVRIGMPSLGSPVYFDPATLEARFTDQLHPTRMTTITGVLVLPVIVPDALGGPDPEGWIDVTNSAITVESDPVMVTVVPADLSEALTRYRNDPLAATIWMFPVLFLYDLALVWAQRRGRRQE
jgi:hypothetical protein